MHLVPSHGHTAMSLEQCMTVWLHAKAGRSESHKTAIAYRDTLAQFRAVLLEAGRDLDSDPGLVAPLAQGWAATSKLSISEADFSDSTR